MRAAPTARAPDMRLLKLATCLLLATVIVLAMLIGGLELFYGEPPSASAGLESFEIEYLTPEEAAELLGEDVAEFRAPRMLATPPPPEVPSPPE